MRRAAALALTAVLLSGCASGTATPESTPDVDAIYLDALRDEIPRLDEVSDGLLLELGTAICDLHREKDDREAAFAESVDIATNSGMFDANEAGFLHGAAVTAYCPEFEL